MKKISVGFGNLFKTRYALIWVLFLMIVMFSFSSSAFRSMANLLGVLRNSGIDAILVLGLTWIVATGGIDVSFPDVAAFTSMITALLIKNGFQWGPTILIALLCGTSFGLLSGFLIVHFKFPPLIATIGVSGIAKAMASLLGSGQPIEITRLGHLVDSLMFGDILGFPILFLLTITIYLISCYLQDQTAIGQYLYALGENRKAVLEAGIQEGKILFSLYAFSALLASIGGILLTALLSSGQPRIGFTFFLSGLTSVFIGAIIIKVGKANVIGTLIGVIILAVLDNGLTLLGLSYYIGLITKGILLITGIVIVEISKFKRRANGVGVM